MPIHEVHGFPVSTPNLNITRSKITLDGGTTYVDLVDAIGTAEESGDITLHTARTDNPHSVTAAQVGAYSASQANAAIAAAVNTLNAGTLAALVAMAPNAAPSVYLAGRVSAFDGGAGVFTWLAGDKSALVSGDPSQGVYVAPSADLTGASGVWTRQITTEVDPQWFGARSDDSGDQYAAITAAHLWARGNNKTLAFRDGTYRFGTTLSFAWQHYAVIAKGARVVLHYTGSAEAVKLDGDVYNATYGAYDFVFGGDHRFIIKGNAAATHCLVTKKVMHGHIRANVYDATYAGWENTGECTLTDFDVVCSGNEQPFTTVPDYGAKLDQMYDCHMRLLIENAEIGAYCTSVAACVISGSVEGNTVVGLYLNSACYRNQLNAVFNEFNGTGSDWRIDGPHNVVICASAVGGTATGGNLQIYGSYNLILGGEFKETFVDVTASNTMFIGAKFLTAPTDDSSTTSYLSCSGHINKLPAVAATAPTLEGTFANYGGGYKSAGYYVDVTQLLHIVGAVNGGAAPPTTIFTLPAGSRPAASVAYSAVNLTTGGNAAIVVASSGVVTLLSGAGAGEVVDITSPAIGLA